MKLPEPGAGETEDQSTSLAAVNRDLPRRKLLILTLIFFTALGVRLLNWQSHHNEALAVQTSVALNYKHQARLIETNGVASLGDRLSITNNPDLLGHPLGYPILLSFINRFAPESDATTQLLQMILDSLSAVIIVLIALEFFPFAVGIITGLMAAFAPQFSWNSLTLLPDSLATLPILLAMLIICRTCRRSNVADRFSLLSVLAAGALIGISVWLRANALLLAPFLACLFFFVCKRGARLRPALILVCGVLLIISPLTIRNAIVFGKFVPVSLGAGQTLIEGIADYNTDGSLGLPQTD
ncbi:MAG TPA: glycosyltransferase family 39 protein, partial [Pyrinomonadaceae bacterium]|nr:glycosyltransferase family 39 protein [Pyrinomonadaceae bacterium]